MENTRIFLDKIRVPIAAIRDKNFRWYAEKNETHDIIIFLSWINIFL